MARRKPNSPTPSSPPATATPVPPAAPAAPAQDGKARTGKARTGRVLIVSAARTVRERLAARLMGGTSREALSCVQVDGTAAALAVLEHGGIDVLMVHAAAGATNDDAQIGGAATDLVRAAAERWPGVASVVVADQPTIQGAIESMRSGAADLVPTALGAEEFRARIAAAVARARARQAADARLEKLKRLCRRLNTGREEVSKQVGSLCNDLALAFQDLSEQMVQMSATGEFAGLIRQELDIESLLRTALEFILAKAGATNAAVFLPSGASGGGGGDYALGAYVNYDCPKDTADVLLEHMAGVVAPKFEETQGVQVFATEDELTAFLEERGGEQAPWITDSTVVAFACRHEGECLAVVTLFRDKRTPFPEPVIATLGTVADLFARQLGRVIHMHHRHLPKDQWGGFGDADDNDVDLAA
jgi:DNA-binding response OmpR family regulator